MKTANPNKTLEKQKFNFSRSALFHMKTRISLKFQIWNCNFKEN